MPEDEKSETEEKPDDSGTDETEETEETQEKDDEDKPDEKVDPEVAKAVKRRDLALKRAQKAEAELAKYKEKEEKADDPVQKANTRLIAASARTVLASAGVTDRDDQKEVLAILNLSDIDVDDTDGPDEDEIADRVERLRSIFGAPKRNTPRVPGSVQPKDRGSKETSTDPDKARYKRIMSGR